MLRSVALSALLLTTALTFPASAADVLQPEGWQTGVMRQPDGQFAYCVSESKFSHDLWIILALNPTGDINFGVGQRGATLPVGQEKQVRLTIDNQPARQMTARAVKPELMVINAGQDQGFLTSLAGGTVLKLDTMTFSLAGSGEAIATLRECVQASTGGAAVAAAPAQAAPAVSQQPADENPANENRIVWNDQPVAPPGQREAVTLPPSMQQAAPVAPAPQRAAQADMPDIAVEPAPSGAAAATEEAARPALAPELTPPEPDAGIARYTAGTQQPPAAQAGTQVPEVTPAQQEPESQVAAMAPVTLPSSAPVAAPQIKPLPAQLERLLRAALVRDLEPAPVTESGVAYAWKSRDMLGNVREIAVPAGSNIVQLAGQHYSDLKARCGADFTASLGQPEDTGALQILTGSTVCRGNGRSVYTTLVFALSRQGVLSIVAHEIDRGRRAAPDRAQAGVVEALKATQG